MSYPNARKPPSRNSSIFSAPPGTGYYDRNVIPLGARRTAPEKAPTRRPHRARIYGPPQGALYRAFPQGPFHLTPGLTTGARTPSPGAPTGPTLRRTEPGPAHKCARPSTPGCSRWPKCQLARAWSNLCAGAVPNTGKSEAPTLRPVSRPTQKRGGSSRVGESHGPRSHSPIRPRPTHAYTTAITRPLFPHTPAIPHTPELCLPSPLPHPA